MGLKGKNDLNVNSRMGGVKNILGLFVTFTFVIVIGFVLFGKLDSKSDKKQNNIQEELKLNIVDSLQYKKN